MWSDKNDTIEPQNYTIDPQNDTIDPINDTIDPVYDTIGPYFQKGLKAQLVSKLTQLVPVTL